MWKRNKIYSWKTSFFFSIYALFSCNALECVEIILVDQGHCIVVTDPANVCKVARDLGNNLFSYYCRSDCGHRNGFIKPIFDYTYINVYGNNIWIKRCLLCFQGVFFFHELYCQSWQLIQTWICWQTIITEEATEASLAGANLQFASYISDGTRLRGAETYD